MRTLAKTFIATVAGGGLALGALQAGASLLSVDASQFAVLGQFSNNQTNFNNGTIRGDIGIGSPRQYTISNGSVVGSIRFSGASNTTGLTPDPDPGSNPGPFTVSGGGTVSGGVVANDSVVTSALNYSNDLSQFLGGESGNTTFANLNSSATINASSGTLFSGNLVDGNALGSYRLFSVSNVNLSNGTTLTINGSATDQVVLNVNDNNPAFNGRILLTGGITSDQVLINMFGGTYATHMGGPTLTISTNGETTTGTFLDPNGGMQISHSVLDGRFFGGDVTNQQIVSGADINAPPPTVPIPAAAWLFGSGLVGFIAIARRRTKGSDSVMRGGPMLAV
jgi:hypothetical protein